MKESAIIEQIRSRLGIESLNNMQTTMASKANATNIVLLSPTGSGKTIAYLLPLLKNIKASTGRVQAVVIAPSRELAVQISKVAQAIAVGLKVTCCYGGHNVTDEENSLSVVPDILVGTPGRLLDHAKRGNVYLQPVRILVLDEFDKSLELGFHEEMRKLIKRMPNISRQILTSATRISDCPDFISLRGAETLCFLSESTVESRINVLRVESDMRDKLETLRTLLYNIEPGKTIIFANHRESAMRIYEYLKKLHLPVGLYHGGLDQIDREKAVQMLNNGTFSIMVTTDLGSRGLDITGVKHIVHYHLPLTEETYTHRNGRTARVDNTGSVYVITGPDEKIPDFISFDDSLALDSDAECRIRKEYETIFFSAGKKEKISKGDILGFILTKSGIEPSAVGRIDVADHYALVAVDARVAKSVLAAIAREKIKNQKVKISIARQ
ncbi:MAG: DEAD/DEAH box helicase [Bacteroidales bacterium]|nr:DEAD/DEAH box helicase [Bacteroidales bacterium]